MTLQGLLVTGRQLERSDVQARHIEEDKPELQREDTKINLVKAKASTNTCRNCGEELASHSEIAQPKENNVETAINSTTLLSYVDL